MHVTPIIEWHVVIQGYRQRSGEPNGMFRLWEKLNGIAGPECRVELMAWNDHWDELAETIRRCTERNGRPDVYVYAFSWGAGWGAMELARELQGRGLVVKTMVLCDPIYRSRWLVFRWLAYLGGQRSGPKIRVPANVLEVRGTYQQNDRLRGHRVVATGKRTRVRQFLRTAGVKHAHMEDHPVFQSMCLEAAGIKETR
jgi:hypothetical protein